MVLDLRPANNLIKLLLFSILLLANICVFADNKLIPIPKGAVNSTLENNGFAQSKSANSTRLFSPKIVGGTTASRGEFPEFVQLFIEGAVIGLDPAFLYPWCGGSLISSNKVLTAAHCTAGLGLRDFYALPNFYTYNDNITFADLIPISSKVEHPNYQQQTAFDYDVSIITLNQNFTTATAKIFSGRDPLEGFNATLIGTGTLSEGGPEPTTLQKVTIPIVSNTVCKLSYGDSAITDRMICAGLQTGTKDSCNGDSGGPLWVEYDGQKTQAGIVSWGNGCARPNFYGVNTRVSTVIEFILQHAPNTKIVEQKPNSLIPVLNLLLLSDSNDIGNPGIGSCDAEVVDINTPLSTRVFDFCIDQAFSPSVYYKSLKFNLPENERISINTSQVRNQINLLQLFSGIGDNKNLIETFRVSADRAKIIDLQAGDYTLIVRTFESNIDIEVSLQSQRCDFMPIELDTATEYVFQHDCQDTDNYAYFVSYHSFTLASAKDIFVTGVSTSEKQISLYKNTGGTLTKLSNNWYGRANQTVRFFESDLAPGNYVIKVANIAENASVTLNIRTINCVKSDSISLGESVLVSYSDDCKTIRYGYRNDLEFTISEPTEVVITSDKSFKHRSFDSTEVDGEHVLVWSFDAGIYKIITTTNDVNTTQTIKLDKRKCDVQDISVGSSVQIDFSGLCRFSENAFSDYRVFSLAQNTTAKITAKSDAVKGLTLYQGAGDQLTQIKYVEPYFNDDSILEENLSPGIYTIRSTTYNKNVPFSLLYEKIN